MCGRLEQVEPERERMQEHAVVGCAKLRAELTERVNFRRLSNATKLQLSRLITPSSQLPPSSIVGSTALCKN